MSIRRRNYFDKRVLPQIYCAAEPKPELIFQIALS